MIPMKIYYEDGHGNAVDENGVAPMDIYVDDEQYMLKTLTTHTQYMQNKPAELPSSTKKERKVCFAML
ncbi:predicted protein [Lichtheimia corymbifera JMRC:FSU:9682]|uniref:Uncharacterized protein n=1 Tax=Lichtheimia corymbifera JMRC:FSU:9682 TaxID=1263082 RepID=A0A068RJ06_9FUNG|nr:predicted protein [Lichtheimia corymbifera JMRC:FSU:9682]